MGGCSPGFSKVLLTSDHHEDSWIWSPLSRVKHWYWQSSTIAKKYSEDPDIRALGPSGSPKIAYSSNTNDPFSHEEQEVIWSALPDLRIWWCWGLLGTLSPAWHPVSQDTELLSLAQHPTSSSWWQSPGWNTTEEAGSVLTNMTMTPQWLSNCISNKEGWCPVVFIDTWKCAYLRSISNTLPSFFMEARNKTMVSVLIWLTEYWLSVLTSRCFLHKEDPAIRCWFPVRNILQNAFHLYIVHFVQKCLSLQGPKTLKR